MSLAELRLSGSSSLVELFSGSSSLVELFSGSSSLAELFSESSSLAELLSESSSLAELFSGSSSLAGFTMSRVVSPVSQVSSLSALFYTMQGTPSTRISMFSLPSRLVPVIVRI